MQRLLRGLRGFAGTWLRICLNVVAALGEIASEISKRV